jgi:hypothetical protein
MDDVARAEQRQGEETWRKRDLLCVTAFALLRRLVRMQGNGELEYNAHGRAYCLFCFVESAHEVHEEDCLYVMARDLLKEVDNNGE